jgi:hypothetical protein
MRNKRVIRRCTRLKHDPWSWEWVLGRSGNWMSLNES